MVSDRLKKLQWFFKSVNPRVVRLMLILGSRGDCVGGGSGRNLNSDLWEFSDNGN